MPIDQPWFPDRLRGPAKRLRCWAMTIAPAFTLASLFAAALSMSYFGLFGEYAARIHPVEDLIPMWAWASAWAVSAAGMFTAGLRPHTKFASWAFTWWALLMFIWGTSWFVGWAQNTLDRGVAFAFLYTTYPLTIAWASWRGSRTELYIQGGPA